MAARIGDRKYYQRISQFALAGSKKSALKIRKTNCSCQNTTLTSLERRFFSALDRGRFDIVKKISAKGLNIYCKSIFEKYTRKDCATCNRDHMDMLGDLFRNREKIFSNSIEFIALTLNHACCEGNLDLVKKLFKPNLFTKSKFAHLMTCAFTSGNIRLVKYLLSKGGSLQEMNMYGFPCINGACMKGHLKLVKFSVANGALNGAYHKIIIDSACFSGNDKLVNYLLNSGIARNRLDFNSMKWACKSGSIGMVKLLLKKGIKLSDGENDALSCACSSGNLRLVKFLGMSGASYAKNAAQNLGAACNSGNIRIVKYLTSHGVSIQKYGGEALVTATYAGSMQIVRYLVKNNADIRKRSENPIL